MVMNATMPPPAARATLLVLVPMTGFAAMASTSPLTVAASGACLMIAIWLLWSGDDPPILLLPPLFQWSQVSIIPLSTIWRQVPLNDLSEYGADLERSAFYGLAGVAALAVGLRLGSRQVGASAFAGRLRAEASAWRFRDVARVAFAAIGFGYACAIISGMAGPARELFHQASNIKYVGLFILAYWCLARGSHYRVLGLVIAFDVLFGMTGFFAEFKNSVLTLLVAAIAARPRVRPADVLIIGVAGALLLSVGIFWSAIKKDYRMLLNQGTGAQVVTIPIGERLSYLMHAASSMDTARISEGFDLLVARHGYIDFLALTLQNVPYAVPHENGRLTLAVLEHIAMPRVLFPSKPPLPSDTEVMSKYTGLPMMWDEDTSISIGYLGELYIDFGLVGGIIAACVIGFVVGFAYRTCRDYLSSPVLLTAGFCMMVALPAASFETAYIKLIGSFVFSSAIAITAQRYALPIVLPKILARPARQAPRSRPARPRG